MTQTTDTDLAGLNVALPADVLRTLPDGVLATLTDWDDETSVRVTMAEAARRDRADRARETRAAAANDLRIAQHAAYLAAEATCRGHLLSRAGQAAGIDPYSLFTGPASRVGKYASEELRDWFDANGRLTASKVAADNADQRRQAADLDAYLASI